jgi:hypothetical protein
MKIVVDLIQGVNVGVEYVAMDQYDDEHAHALLIDLFIFRFLISWGTPTD